jgi:hypothetical protein
MIKTILNIIKIWGLFLLIAFQTNPASGIENHYAGGRSFALSHASVSFPDAWAGFHNQAGLSFLTDISAGFFFESKFGVEELSLAAGSMVLPAGEGAFGISFFQFGKGVYKENKFGLAYSRQLAERWSAGIQLDYFSQTFPENERTKGFATFEGGLLFKASENLILGTHVFNPVSAGIEMPGGKQKMPVVFRAGGHYLFDETVLVAFEAEKDNQNPLLFKSGIEFFPVESLALRFGASGKPFKYTAGFGYRTGPISADFAFGYHGNLGISPSVSVQIHFR